MSCRESESAAWSDVRASGRDLGSEFIRIEVVIDTVRDNIQGE